MAVKVRERPKGSGVWWVFIDHHGKRKAKKIGKDKKLARQVAKKIEAKLVLGEFELGKERPPCPTFKECADIWLALPHEEEWKESTRESYRFNLTKHVYPIFGQWRVDELRRKDFKVFFDKLLLGGMKPGSAKLMKAAVNGVLNHAVDSELIETNPLNGLKIAGKRSASSDVDPLTEQEAEQLLEQAKEYLEGIYYPSFLCALRTGMRIGEIQALKWKDIDFNDRLIEVKRSHRRERTTDTKNRKPRRVDMTPHLAETLKALNIYQKRVALQKGRPVSDWVFAQKNGKMLNREAFRNALNRCLKASKLKRIRIHDLRHTYATIRLLKGHNVGDVSYQLGHSSISITYDIYGHWIPGAFKSEVDELDNSQPSATHPQP